MRRTYFILTLSLAVGLIAFGVVFLWQKSKIDNDHKHLTAFNWFCQEFEITNAQRERIEALHLAYFPECEDHCIHYANTKEILEEINADPGLDDNKQHIEAAKRLAELKIQGDMKFVEFIHRVAAEMDREAGNRYLRCMEDWIEESIKVAVK